MDNIYIEDRGFDKIDFTVESVKIGNYENCTFTNCNFAEADLSNFVFAECLFTECNLTMIKTQKTTLRDVQFRNCKLVGVHFDHCNDFLFTVFFENCNIDLSSFYKMQLKKQSFIKCSLHEVDFTDAVLTEAVFDSCNLAGAIFENTNLEKADFRTSHNYSIDPVKNKMRKARFSVAGALGLLDRFDLEIS